MVTEFSTETFLLIGSILFFTSMFIGNAGHRFGVPVLLLFLGVGMLFGSDGFGLRFENVQLAEAIGVICLCIILFSGGLDTKFTEIKRIIAPGIVLATVGVLLTCFITGYFTWWLSNNFFGGAAVSLLTALLLAATCSSTDSASVFGILRSKGLSLKNNLRSLLELESGSNDPVAYILTVMFISLIKSGTAPNIPMAVSMTVVQLIIGGLLGYFFGRLAVIVINKARIENESLYAVLVLTVCVFVFSGTSFLKGNGYLAVYIAGLVIGNHKFVHKRSVMKFMDGFAWLSQILLFLTLGLLVNPGELLDVLWIGIIIGLFMIFIARPLTVFITLIPFRKIQFKDQGFISWVGLRGAVPIIFAIMPLAAGVPGARWIFNIVFVITIVSLLVQGTTLPLVAKLLGLVNKPNVFKQIEDFDMEFSEEIKSAMTEILITEETLTHGRNLMEMPLPDKTLAVMVKRGDKFFIPTGKTELMAKDKLLVISDDEDALRETYKNMGIQNYSYKKNR
ncbi:MAG: potassium/proton antiporter [Dysgonamonadaceae bacterium]|jgi:cell volume regulation protein A|nr:potassium/proton antiporter [Dysgonamonadaceae bacterium]